MQRCAYRHHRRGHGNSHAHGAAAGHVVSFVLLPVVTRRVAMTAPCHLRVLIRYSGLRHAYAGERRRKKHRDRHHKGKKLPHDHSAYMRSWAGRFNLTRS